MTSSPITSPATPPSVPVAGLSGAESLRVGAGDRLALAVAGPIATLTLGRPPVNAIDDAMLRAVQEALAVLAARPEVVVLRIRSEQKVFCAGADLEMVGARLASEEGAREMVRTVELFHEVYGQLAAAPFVSVAEMAGHALGGGLELALACDLRIAAHEARLGLPEAKVGLLPGAGGTQRLTALCGPGVAARLILTGELVDGATAQSLGLVQWAAPAAELAAAGAALAGRIAALSPDALRAAKGCIAIASAGPGAGLRAEIEGIGALMRAPSTRQRVRAFLTR